MMSVLTACHLFIHPFSIQWPQQHQHHLYLIFPVPTSINPSHCAFSVISHYPNNISYYLTHCHPYMPLKRERFPSSLFAKREMKSYKVTSVVATATWLKMLILYCKRNQIIGPSLSDDIHNKIHIIFQSSYFNGQYWLYGYFNLWSEVIGQAAGLFTFGFKGWFEVAVFKNQSKYKDRWSKLNPKLKT